MTAAPRLGGGSKGSCEVGIIRLAFGGGGGLVFHASGASSCSGFIKHTLNESAFAGRFRPLLFHHQDLHPLRHVVAHALIVPRLFERLDIARLVGGADR